MSADRKPKLRVGLMTRDVSDDFLIYDNDAGEIYLLNPTAAAIVELCDGTLDAAGIVDEIVAITKAPPDEVLGDVKRTLEELSQQRLVEWSE